MTPYDLTKGRITFAKLQVGIAAVSGGGAHGWNRRPRWFSRPAHHDASNSSRKSGSFPTQLWFYIDRSRLPGELPRDLAKRLAREKAAAVAESAE